MGDTIQFPKNYERLILKAVEHIRNGELNQAEETVKEAYHIKKGKTANALYTSILVKQGYFKEAKEIADEQFEIYTQTTERRLFYLDLLIESGHLIHAESFLKKWGTEIDPREQEQWKRTEDKLNDKIEERILQDKNRLEDNKVRLGNLSGFSTEEQLEIIQSSESMPLKVFDPLVRSLFIHPLLSQEIKTVLLHEWLARKPEEKTGFDWHGKMIVVDPTSQVPLHQQKTYQKIHQILEEKTAKDPTLYNMLRAEVDRQLFLLFPCLDTVITNPEKWVNLYLSYYQTGEITKPTPKEREGSMMEEWFYRLNQ